MPFFDSTGVRIYYESVGAGRPVVLVHGLTSSIQQNWRRPGIVDALVKAEFRAVTLDCRGHGKSDKPYERGAYSGTQMGDDVIALMDHLSIDVADLVGYSMGGAIATSLLTRCPARLRRVVIAGVGDSVLGAGWGIPRGSPRGRTRISGRDFAVTSAIRNAERVAIDVEKLIGAMCPVLILVGSGDRVAGSPSRLAVSIRGSKMVRVPGTHFSAVAHPTFRQAIVEFLSS